ncbi:MAG: hypothetical protein N2257_09375, partial [Thermodesulfovibrionales bacterium]|nr:hypothetical protein [Thermodesulfovibrionales bacterium]
ERESKEFRGTILEEPFFSVKALNISHGVQVLAFRIDEEVHINIDKAKLRERGIETGPWLSEFKEAIITNEKNRIFRAGSKWISFEEIKDIALFTEGQKISYVMDVSIEDENIERIINFVKGSDYLYCEAFFLERDIDLASERNHLTARLAGEIARKAGVKNLVAMHLSLRYKDQPEVVIEEAMRAFSGKD